MSFAERNKTWLLPVLAVGVVAVFWFNLHDSGPTPPPIAAAAPESTVSSPQGAPTPGEAPAAPAPVAAAPSPLPPLGPEAWADLRPLNSASVVLKPSLDLAAEATHPLSHAQLFPPSFPSTASQSLASPAMLVLPKSGNSASAAEPPPLEFISRTPDGLRAWYDGVGFKAGQTILGTAYRVVEIHPPAVVIEGPDGRRKQTTFTFQPSTPNSVSPETP